MASLSGMEYPPVEKGPGHLYQITFKTYDTENMV